MTPEITSNWTIQDWIGNVTKVNFALTNEGNQNIGADPKLLLNWHFRFGHLNLPAVQRILRAFPFTANRFASASKCNTLDLKCEICQYSKGHRRSTNSSTITANPERTGALTAEHLGPGVRVSVDHFESRLLGRTFDSYGKPSADTYKGGCIFVDHGTGYIQVEHQLGFSAVETIRAKKTMSNRQWTMVSLYNPISLTVEHSKQTLLFNIFENILSVFNTVEQMHTIKMV
jgi:hypothetical protein